MVSAIGLRSRKHEVCRTHEERFPLADSPPNDAGKGNNAVVREHDRCSKHRAPRSECWRAGI